MTISPGGCRTFLFNETFVHPFFRNRITSLGFAGVYCMLGQASQRAFAAYSRELGIISWGDPDFGGDSRFLKLENAHVLEMEATAGPSRNRLKQVVFFHFAVRHVHSFGLKLRF